MYNNSISYNVCSGVGLPKANLNLNANARHLFNDIQQKLASMPKNIDNKHEAIGFSNLVLDNAEVIRSATRVLEYCQSTLVEEPQSFKILKTLGENFGSIFYGIDSSSTLTDSINLLKMQANLEQVFAEAEVSGILTANSFSETNSESGFYSAPPSTMASASSSDISTYLGYNSDAVLVDIILLFIEIYKSGIESVAIFIERTASHQEAQENLNKYAQAFNYLSLALIEHPPSSADTFSSYFNKAVAVSSSTGQLENPELYNYLEPLASILGLSENYYPGSTSMTHNVITNGFANLYIQMSKDLQIIGMEPPVWFITSGGNVQIDTAIVREINEYLETAIVTAGDLSQEDAKYIEALQASLTLYMKAASGSVDCLTSINNAIYR